MSSFSSISFLGLLTALLTNSGSVLKYFAESKFFKSEVEETKIVC